MAHFGAAVGLLIEKFTEIIESSLVSSGEFAKQVQCSLGGSEPESNLPIISHIHQVVAAQGVDWASEFIRLTGTALFSPMTQTEQSPWPCKRVCRTRRYYRIETEICRFQLGSPRFQKAQQVHPELVQRKVPQG